MQRQWYALGFLLLAGCAREEPVYSEQLFTFGTLVEISTYGTPPAEARAAVAAVTGQLNQWHQDWHAWQPGTLTRFNAALQSGQPTPIPATLAPLLQRSQQLAQVSDELFNPAVGKLSALWGFAQDELPSGPPPESSAIAALREAQPRMSDITLTPRTAQSRNPAVQLDFGAIAKGYAVDLAVAQLKARGLRNAIVNMGGNLRAYGQHGDRPWRIGIRHPRGQGILASVTIQGDEAVLTSGDYERFYMYQGQRYHHIMDPRRGGPARGLTSVTVIYADATTADAASTALFVAGPEHWPRIARQMGISHVMVVEESGKISLTPAMAQRVHFELKPAPVAHIVTP